MVRFFSGEIMRLEREHREDLKRTRMIRKAKSEDVKVIRSLLLAEVPNGKVLRRSVKELKKAIRSFFVYEEDDRIVGCCSLEIYSKKIAEIRSLVVSLEYRNRGVGRTLIQECLEEARKKKIYQVLSITDKSDFFERFGFRTQVNEKQAMFLKT